MIRIARGVGAWVPDATATAVLMLVVLVIAALAVGNSFTATLDGFYRGLWMLLAFTMQMTLLLLLSTVVGASGLFSSLVERVAVLPRSSGAVLLVAVLLTAGLSYFYWALGVALGPLIAVRFAREAERRGIKVDFPCLLAATFAGSSIWQFGLSSSPALLVATPGHFLESKTGVIPLASTIGSTGAILIVVLFPLLLVALARLVMPRDPAPLSAFPQAEAMAATANRDALAAAAAAQAAESNSSARGFARWSERSRALPLLLAALVGAWLYHHFINKGASMDLNSMVSSLLLLALLLQPNLAAFSAALRSSVESCWQVMVLYQVYGGVAGVLQFTTLGAVIAEAFARLSSPLTFPLLTALAGTAVAIFVPSSGGQWVIQGFITSEAAAAVGASAQQGLLALGIGDQMGNLVSPFWLVVVAGVARVDFRQLYGYSLLFGLLWFVLGVTVLTLVPA